MPGGVSEATVGRAARRRRSLRALVLSALLAALTTLLSAGAASADFWPHGQPEPPVAAQ